MVRRVAPSLKTWEPLSSNCRIEMIEAAPALAQVAVKSRSETGRHCEQEPVYDSRACSSVCALGVVGLDPTPSALKRASVETITLPYAVSSYPAVWCASATGAISTSPKL